MLATREKSESMVHPWLSARQCASGAAHDMLKERGKGRALLVCKGNLAFSSNDPSSFLPELPTLQQLRQARQQVYGTIEPIPGKGLYLRVLAPVTMPYLSGETRILQLLQPVPTALSETAESVQNVYQDYQELSYSRESLKQVFALTLTLVLMLAMLSAIAIAFVLSRRLSAPLGVRAEGTHAIARGDYSTCCQRTARTNWAYWYSHSTSMTRQLGDATRPPKGTVYVWGLHALPGNHTGAICPPV